MASRRSLFPRCRVGRARLNAKFHPTDYCISDDRTIRKIHAIDGHVMLAFAGSFDHTSRNGYIE